MKILFAASPLSIVTDVLAILLLGLCAYWDLRYRKIPNWATLPGIVLGLGMNTLQHGWGGIKASGLGLLIGFGALLVLFVLSWMGGGDVKLMAAVGALKGYPFVLSALFYSLIVGVVIGVIMLIWKRRTLRTFKNLFMVVGSRVTRLVPKQDIDREQAQKIPFGLAIILGTLWAMIMGYAWSPITLAGL
ncbi:MAG: prepilin peptidase [candidate division WOR-3 bacterium]|nr:MAG: prepilin peptidase [candidate division WOR-3 bacterium]